MNKIDLQIQSTASDGKHSPAEIVSMAKELGIEVIALTDHDTVGGVKEALEAGEEKGIRVIPGIEMSVEEQGAHILGFGVDFKNEKLLSELQNFQVARVEGGRKMAENLQNAGFQLTFEEVLQQAGGGVVARPHLARAVLARPENKEKLDGASSVHEFIEKFLSDSSPLYVKRKHISAKEGISLIRESGGVAVWSHPAICFPDDYESLEKLLKNFLDWGIEGLEVFNPSHTEDDVEFLETVCGRYGLLRTAGSDFHVAEPPRTPDERGLRPAATLGDYETFGFSVEGIVPTLDEAMKKRKERAG